MVDPAPQKAVVKAPQETPTPWSVTSLASRKYDTYLSTDVHGPDIPIGVVTAGVNSSRT